MCVVFVSCCLLGINIVAESSWDVITLLIPDVPWAIWNSMKIWNPWSERGQLESIDSTKRMVYSVDRTKFVVCSKNIRTY